MKKMPAYVYDKNQLPELLTVVEAAMFLRMSETAVHNRIRAGKIKALIDDKIIRIHRSSILEYAGLKEIE